MLILFATLCLGLQSNFFPSGYTDINFLCIFLLPMYVICHTYLILPDLSPVKYSLKSTYYIISLFQI